MKKSSYSGLQLTSGYVYVPLFAIESGGKVVEYDSASNLTNEQQQLLSAFCYMLTIPPCYKPHVWDGCVGLDNIARMEGGKIVEWNEYLKLTDEQKQLITEYVEGEVKKGNPDVR